MVRDRAETLARRLRGRLPREGLRADRENLLAPIGARGPDRAPGRRPRAVARQPIGELSFDPQGPRLAAADLPELRLGKKVFEGPVRALVDVAVAGVVVVVLVGTDQAVPQVDERPTAIAHVSLEALQGVVCPSLRA